MKKEIANTVGAYFKQLNHVASAIDQKSVEQAIRHD